MRRYIHMPLTPEQEKVVREAIADGRITVADYKSIKWHVYSAREMWAYWYLRAWLALQPLRRRLMVARHRFTMFVREHRK